MTVDASPAFRLQAEFAAAGDQPEAIEALVKGLESGSRYQTLLGITGSGKSATIAWTIEQVQRPTLILAPNKALGAQLANEFRQFFPENKVEYFVSYYDYYQPEAYIPQSDTYIEKDATINDEIDRLRHAATAALLTRRDVIIVASVSAIYGLGSPEEYEGQLLRLIRGVEYPLDAAMRRLVDIQYDRNEINLTRGKFRVKGDTLEIFPSYEEKVLRIEYFGDEVDRLLVMNPVTGEVLDELNEAIVFPATHYSSTRVRMNIAMGNIEIELADRLAYLEDKGKLLEAQRLRMRTSYDLEMMREIGFCSGIENYSRHLDGREPGEAPYTLLDYFPDDYLMVIDESHVAVPQIRGQYEGDRSRKDVLVDHGFRLPSAMDNRPLRFDEWVEKTGQVVFMSATPGPWELKHSDAVVEQIVRPTGLVDPEVIIKPTKGQIDDLLEEIHLRAGIDQRILVTTLTKKMSEDLTDYLLEMGVRARYLHSEIDTLETSPDSARPQAGRVRRARWHQPAPRRPRPPGGVSGGHPRRRQGRIPPLGDEPRPDDRAGSQERRWTGDHVRRSGHRLDAAGCQRDAAAAVAADAPQRRARHRSANHPQEGFRHTRADRQLRRSGDRPQTPRSGAEGAARHADRGPDPAHPKSRRRDEGSCNRPSVRVRGAAQR